MSIGFIGAGKVGTALGYHFSASGIKLSGYFSRSHSSTLEAAIKTGSKEYNTIADIIEDSDIIFITTSDDSIHLIYEQMMELSFSWESRIVCHTSGVHSSNILTGLYEKGATICSMHPIQSFADFKESILALKNTSFTLEGRGAGMDNIKDILVKSGNNYTEISAEEKPLYHAAASVISNYMVTLLDTGLDMLVSAGLEQQQAIALASQLIEGTLKNIDILGTKRALTGPISRGDIATIEKHVSVLRQKSDAWLDFYRVMGFLTIDLAESSGKIAGSIPTKLKEVLKDNE